MLLSWTLAACLVPDPPPAQGCADCHGSGSDPAPPAALGGVTDPFSRGVGAHQLHLRGTDGSAAVDCAECHLVPGSVDAPGHLDGAPLAEVGWAEGTIAKVGAEPYDAENGTCLVYCHGADRPVWTEPGSVACGDCHGAPPPPPHPDASACGDCHGGGPGEPARHVDGTVDLLGGTTTLSTADTGTPPDPAGCAEGCHGTATTPAPPPDTSGSADPTAVGVGAHAAHLDTTRAVPVPCDGCHVVPAAVADPGHLQDVPADDTFTGVAVARGAAPVWNAGPATCSGTYCHDQGGAAPAPVWTDPRDAGCADCHGDPPARPHPQDPDCAGCHPHAGDDAVLHVDGTVQR